MEVRRGGGPPKGRAPLGTCKLIPSRPAGSHSAEACLSSLCLSDSRSDLRCAKTLQRLQAPGAGSDG